ncbi:MAG: thermonuclease family protein [Prosthecochloris sp.]|nr:thermonuclease family protein [Prosthecochloris sp.]
MKTVRYASAALLVIGGIAAYLSTTHPFRPAWKPLVVFDGDSFVLQKNRHHEEFRLYGIDCPEQEQPFGEPARAFTDSMLSAGTIRIERLEQDVYGRTVARVFVDQQSLNEALLFNGLGWHYTFFSDDEHYAELERLARLASKGLWSQPDPTPPWDFRHRQADRSISKHSRPKRT